MSKTFLEDLKKMNDVVLQYRTKREQILNSIRSNQNCFDDDVVLCRVVAELSQQISDLEATIDRRTVLVELGLLDTPENDA